MLTILTADADFASSTWNGPGVFVGGFVTPYLVEVMGIVVVVIACYIIMKIVSPKQ